MSIFLVKSILSVVLLSLALLSMITMFEIFGRNEERADIQKLKRLHRITGFIYIVLFAFISYYCLRFIVLSGTELSPRSALHTVLALSILALFGVKILITRIYRVFYNQAKIFGLTMALITFVLFGTSGGYYFMVTKFGTDKTFDKTMPAKQTGITENMEKTNPSLKKIRTDAESIRKGRELYESKCRMCHDPYSAKMIVGPGHKDILKSPVLPASGRPATPENIANQLKNPFKTMPSFAYLSDDDIQHIIAFLNTL